MGVQGVGEWLLGREAGTEARARSWRRRIAAAQSAAETLHVELALFIPCSTSPAPELPGAADHQSSGTLPAPQPG